MYLQFNQSKGKNGKIYRSVLLCEKYRDQGIAKTRVIMNLSKLPNDIITDLKAITNKSSAIFIRSVRLEKAKELLQNTTLSVSEVAYATGFSNPNWFGKAFKDQFGVNPSEIKS